MAATVMRGRTADETARYLDLLLAGDAETTARALDSIMRIDIRPELAAVGVPTMVFHRRDDQLVRLESASVVAAGIPGARLSQLSGNAHFPQFGDVDELATALAAFLREGDPESVVPITARESDASVARTASPRLSARETEVLRLLALGRTNQQIADQLTISTFTVARHVSSIFAKTGAVNRTDAARIAREQRRV
jgi:DNA-binding CsgD family transcriptional regulator